MSIIITLLSFTGAVLYRWRGMNSTDVPQMVQSRTLRRILFSLVVGVTLTLTCGLWGLLGIPLSYTGVVIGHGSYFPGGGLKIDNESTRWFTKDPMGEMMKFWGMCVTGLVMTVPIGILTMVVSDPVQGGLIAISGFGKGVVYHIPRINTETAEKLWGGLSVLSIGLVSLL